MALYLRELHEEQDCEIIRNVCDFRSSPHIMRKSRSRWIWRWLLSEQDPALIRPSRSWMPIFGCFARMPRWGLLFSFISVFINSQSKNITLSHLSANVLRFYLGNSTVCVLLLGFFPFSLGPCSYFLWMAVDYTITILFTGVQRARIGNPPWLDVYPPLLHEEGEGGERRTAGCAWPAEVWIFDYSFAFCTHRIYQFMLLKTTNFVVKFTSHLELAYFLWNMKFLVVQTKRKWSTSMVLTWFLNDILWNWSIEFHVWQKC